MNFLIQTLIVLGLIDLMAYPFYAVWFTRRGNPDYSFQNFHRIFIFLVMATVLAIITAEHELFKSQIVLVGLFFSTGLIHGTDLTKNFLIRVRRESKVLIQIVKDLWKTGWIIDESDEMNYSVPDRVDGRRWRMMQYIFTFGTRLVCDLFAIALLANL